VWAVAAPANAAVPGNTVTASGQLFSTAGGHTFSTNMTATTMTAGATATTLLGLANTGQLFSDNAIGTFEDAGAGGGRTTDAGGGGADGGGTATSHRAWLQYNASSAVSSFHIGPRGAAARRNNRRSSLQMGGRPMSVDLIRRRRHGEIMQTADSNASGAFMMSTLFSGAGTGAGWYDGIAPASGRLAGGFGGGRRASINLGRQQTGSGAHMSSIVNRWV
jgi:hypothetical protein